VLHGRGFKNDQTGGLINFFCAGIKISEMELPDAPDANL